jgi:cytochrome c oxidase subunit 2
VLASQQGRPIDALLRLLFSIAAVIFSLVISFLIYSVIAFRRQPGDLEDARPIYGNVPLEIAWTVIPLIIVLWVGGYGASALLDITRQPSEEELVVEVTGFQFAWSFDYPDFGFMSMELVLPVNRPVLFRIRSIDVIHSFWIPEFRIKTDAIPGVLNETRITPTEVGDYIAYCSELCGTRHAYMTAPVRVVEEPIFQEWVREQQEAAQAARAIVEEGKRYAQQFGCLGCHSTDGRPLAGPTFQGLFGSYTTFEDGTATAARAHVGAPYPVLLEQAVGPYIVSALADPDVGVGTFIVQATLAGGESVPADTVVTLWVWPEDGHADETDHQAQRQETRKGERFVVKVPFDAEGMWQVRLVLEGAVGRGETTFRVRVTPPGPGWVTTLVCLLPFIALGGLWLIGALRHHQAPTS